MALVAGAMAVTASAAHAVPLCSGTTLTKSDGSTLFTATPIYITGSSAAEPMLKIIGQKLASQATNPYVIIYLKDGSCVGVNRINTDGMIAAGTTMFYVPPDQDPTKATPTCTQTAAQLGDIVLSDADATLCPGISAQPAGTKDFQGPVNNMVMVVPSKSFTDGNQAISAEDAYLVFGKGAAGMVTPWIDPTAYDIRTPDSGTRAMINANIGVTTHPWLGNDGTANGGTAFGSGSLYNAVNAANSTNAADSTIGILGSDFLDQSTTTGTTTTPNRMNVKALAFRAFGQHFAYWPDSNVSSYDKRNVREGRYAIWGYLHILASVASGKDPRAMGIFREMAK